MRTKPNAPRQTQSAQIPEFADELRTAIQLLRAHNFHRAANRLEQTSQKILNPQAAKKYAPRVQHVQIVGGSGRTAKTKMILENLNLEITHE